MPRKGVDEWFWNMGELQRLSEELLRSRPAVASGRAWEPRVDLVEDSRRFILKAEIAGVRAEDIQVVYLAERHSVLLRGFRREEDGNPDRQTCHQLEIFFGEFAREVRLPDKPVDPQGMRAQYRNGFLVVMIPKLEKYVATRSVKVRGSHG